VFFGEDEDVVEEDYYKVVEVWAEDVVHGTLEGCRCVGESEGHDLELVVAISCHECCFGLIILGDSDLPVTGFKVDFGED
jgi:hypothetical protein